MEKIVQAYTFGQLQDFATFLRSLDRAGISREEFLGYVEREKDRRFKANEKARRNRAEIERRLPECPSCRIPMILRDAGDGGSHWTCPKCRLGRYDPRSVDEARKEVRRS